MKRAAENQPSRPRRARRAASGSRRLRRRRGMTAIEYMFMLSLIFLAVLIAVQHLGSTLKDSFNHADSKMQGVGL